MYGANSAWLNELLIEEKLFSKQDQNIRHSHNAILIRQYLNRLHEIPYDSKLVKKITDYLDLVDDWGLYEINLFGNSILFMPVNVVDRLCKKALQKKSLFVNESDTKHSYGRILINIILNRLESRELKGVLSLFALADSNLNGSRFYFEQNKINFLRGIYVIKMGDEERGKRISEQAISVMKSMKDFETATAHENELKKYLIQHIN